MSPEEVKKTYAKFLTEKVLVKRYVGTGQNRSYFEIEVRARVMGFVPSDLTGNIIQGDRRIILFADDLLDKGFVLPITINDQIVVRGRELAVTKPDDSTRRINGVLVAYDIQVRG